MNFFSNVAEFLEALVTGYFLNRWIFNYDHCRQGEGQVGK